MTFLSCGSLVFSVPWELFLTKKIQEQTETVVQRSSVEKVFLEILQNSQENTCARVSFLIKLQTLRTLFLTEHLRRLLLHLQWLLLYLFKKVLLNSYFATSLWRTNIFYFSTHRLIIQSRTRLFIKLSSIVRFSK